MSSKSTKHSKHIAGVDFSKMNARDILESAAMLYSCCTIMRSTFGILTMMNDAQEPPLSVDDLKEFAGKFDAVHTCFFDLYRALQAKGMELNEKEKADTAKIPARVHSS